MEQQRLQRQHDVQVAWLEHIKAKGEAEKAMVNVGVDHVNKLLSMSRAIAAQGAGLNATTYGAPYPGSTTNIVTTPQQQKSSALPMIAGILLGAMGVGATGGALYALKGTATPVVTAPASSQKFTVDIGFDPDKGGLNAGPVKPEGEPKK